MERILVIILIITFIIINITFSIKLINPEIRIAEYIARKIEICNGVMIIYIPSSSISKVILLDNKTIVVISGNSISRDYIITYKKCIYSEVHSNFIKIISNGTHVWLEKFNGS